MNAELVPRHGVRSRLAGFAADLLESLAGAPERRRFMNKYGIESLSEIEVAFASRSLGELADDCEQLALAAEVRSVLAPSDPPVELRRDREEKPKAPSGAFSLPTVEAKREREPRTTFFGSCEPEAPDSNFHQAPGFRWANGQPRWSRDWS